MAAFTAMEHVHVSLLFDDADLEVARQLKDGLNQSEIVVTASNEHLRDPSSTWGKPEPDILDSQFAERIDYCIVLLSKNLLTRLRQNYPEKAALYTSAVQRPDFLLPVALEDPLLGLPPYLQTLGMLYLTRIGGLMHLTYRHPYV